MNPEVIDKKIQIFSIKSILLMLIPLTCTIVLHIVYIWISSLYPNYIGWLTPIKFIIPIIISIFLVRKITQDNYKHDGKLSINVIGLCIISYIISYSCTYLIVELITNNLKITISRTILNYIIDGIEMLILYFISKVLCKNYKVNSKTLWITILVISIIEFIIRSKRIYLYTFFINFGFSTLTIIQIISILCSIFNMIIPVYTVSLNNKIKK